VARADEMAARSGADTLIELGSGTSEKTRLLLDAFHRGALRRFVPFTVGRRGHAAGGAGRGRRSTPGWGFKTPWSATSNATWGSWPVGGAHDRLLGPARSATSDPGGAAGFLADIVAQHGAGRTPSSSDHRPGEGRRPLEAAIRRLRERHGRLHRNLLHRLNRWSSTPDFVPDRFRARRLFDTSGSRIGDALRSSVDQW